MLSFLPQLFLPGPARCRRLVLYWQNLLPRPTRRCHWRPKIEHQALRKPTTNHAVQRSATPVQSEHHVQLLANHHPPSPVALQTWPFILLTRHGLLHPLALGDYESTSRRLPIICISCRSLHSRHLFVLHSLLSPLRGFFLHKVFVDRSTPVIICKLLTSAFNGFRHHPLLISIPSRALHDCVFRTPHHASSWLISDFHSLSSNNSSQR